MKIFKDALFISCQGVGIVLSNNPFFFSEERVDRRILMIIKNPSSSLKLVEHTRTHI